MSKLSKLFTEAPIYTPKRSGYDMSHENLLTAGVGTITPLLVEEVCGNTDISLGIALKVQLPPACVDFFGRIDAKVEAFFCPYRLCYGGFQDLLSQINPITDSLNGSYSAGFTSPTANHVNPYEVPVYKDLPTLSITPDFLGPGSLADYLGVKNISASATMLIDNPMPFVAYHRIYESFYRPANLQKPAFIHPSITGAPGVNAKSLPFVRLETAGASIAGTSCILNDGVSILSLRQRCFSDDRFTKARVTPLGGSSEGSTSARFTYNVAIDTRRPDGTAQNVSVGSLRAANVLQEFIDRYNIAGPKWRDAMYAKNGCKPNVCCEEPIYLGRSVFNCYNKSIFQSQPNVEGAVAEGNPFNSVASEYARTESTGAASLIDHYHCTEPGLIFVNFTLVPHAYYSTGTRRYLYHKNAVDFGDALLQNLGDDVIYSGELISAQGKNNVFGYTPRYSHLLYHDDEVHGLFRDGENLDVYALQRSFVGEEVPTISLDFVQIPLDYLDQVNITTAKASRFGCFVDSFLAEKLVTPLCNSVVPTFGRPEGMRKASVALYGKHI